MRGLQLAAHGTPGRFVLRELPDPIPSPGEVLIKVEACGLNHLDLWLEQGALPLPLSLPRIPGGEIAGIVESTTAGAEPWRPGQRVAVQSNLFCSECEFCRRGEESVCLNGELLGVQRDGGFATYVSVPARALVELPDAVSFETSAALTLAGSTAIHMLTDRTQVKPGMTVLVVGGSSGVGSAAIQIARRHGARVLSTASTEAKRSLARSLGADEVFDSRGTEWPSQVRKATAKRGVDLIVEHAGGSVFERCFSCLARGGTIVTCGATTGKMVSLDLWPFFVKQQRVIGSYGRNRVDISTTLAAAEQGWLKPVIDTVVPLEHGPAAFERLRRGEVLGKLLLRP